VKEILNIDSQQYHEYQEYEQCHLIVFH